MRTLPSAALACSLFLAGATLPSRDPGESAAVPGPAAGRQQAQPAPAQAEGLLAAGWPWDDPVHRMDCDDWRTVRPDEQVYFDTLAGIELGLAEAIEIAVAYTRDRQGMEDIEVFKAGLNLQGRPYYQVELYTHHIGGRTGEPMYRRIQVNVDCERKRVSRWTRKNRLPGTVPVGPMLEMPSGILYNDVFVGDGELVRDGVRVKIDYTVTLLDGTLVTNTYDFDRSPEFPLSQAPITGLIHGLEGMRVNGKRKLVIPPHLAFGPEGDGRFIPKNATVVYDVELRQVR